MSVGITKKELAFLVGQFANGGLEAVGLVRSQPPDHEAALRVCQRDPPQSCPELAFPLISLWFSDRREF